LVEKDILDSWSGKLQKSDKPKGYRFSNNESSEVFDIIQPGRRVKLKVTGSKLSITSDDSLFTTGSTKE